MRRLLLALILLIFLTGSAQAVNVTAYFNKTYALVNDTTQYINLTYLDSFSNDYVEFRYSSGGSGDFDNANGGYWTKYAGFTLVSATTEDAQYRLEINGTTWELYNTSGGLEGSGTVADFWTTVNSTGADIRAYSGTQMYFWVENWNATAQIATIWVNLTAGSSELNLAYGNSLASQSSYHNGTMTFLAFDDFDGGVAKLDWIANAGNWIAESTEGGILNQTDVVGTVKKFAYADVDLPASYIVGAKIQAPFSYDSTGRFGLLIMNDSTSAYGIVTKSLTPTTEISMIHDNVVWYGVAAHGLTLSTGTWYKMEAYYAAGVQKGRLWAIGSPTPGWQVQTAQPDLIGGVPRAGLYGQYGEVAWFDDFYVANATDPADVSGFKTGIIVTYPINTSLNLNSNLAAQYIGELNSTNPTSGKIAIANYWIAGNNSLYFLAESGNFDAIVDLNYTLVDIPEKRTLTFDDLTVNSTFKLPDGTRSNTAEVKFNTTYNYSITITVNGAPYTNFSYNETVVSGTKYVTITLNDLPNGTVDLSIFINFAAATIYITVFDEATTSTVAGEIVYLLDSNYNQIVYATSNATGIATLETVWFGDGFIKCGNFTNYYPRQIKITVPVGGTTNSSIYIPSTSSNVAQIVFEINDLTGTYSFPMIMTIKKYVSRDELVILHTDNSDIQDSVTAYLIVAEHYQIYLTTGGQTINYGWFAPSASATVPIELGEVSLSPVYTALQKDIVYEFSYENGSIELDYLDRTGTTNVIKFWVYNASNESELFYYASQASSSDITFIFDTSVIPNSTNITYLAKFEANTTTYGNITASEYLYGEGSRIDIPIEEWQKTFLFGGFLLLLSFMFGYRDSKKGAVIISILAAMFTFFGFIQIQWSFVMLALSLSVLAYLAQSAKRWEGVQ